MLIKKPSEIAPKATLTALIYGQPGIGKTTLALSAPQPVLLDFDNGVNRVNGAHQVDTVQPQSWEQVQDILTEIRDAGDTYKTIVVDTIGKMMSYIEDYIKRTEPRMAKNGILQIKGYGLRKQIFVNFISQVSLMGKNVIFVAHQREEKRDDNVAVRPEIGGTAGDELMKELDLVGYMQAVGRIRTIDFDPSEAYYAKNSCDMRAHNSEGKVVPIALPKVVNDSGVAEGKNDFMSQVVAAFNKRQQANAEQTAEFETLIAEGKATINGIETALEANDALEWVLTAKHVYNSAAVLKQALHAKCTALGLKFDKTKKCYE